MNGDNGKPKEKFEQMKFKYYMNIGMNDDGTFAFQTNIPNIVLGYGMLEFSKGMVVNHVAKLKQKSQPSIIPPKGGIMDFVRGGRK